MLFSKSIGLLLCALILTSCANGSWFENDKKAIEGDRLRILPEAIDDKNVSNKQPLIISNSQENHNWQPESGKCNLEATLTDAYKDSINLEVSDVFKYNEIPMVVQNGNLYLQNSNGNIISYNKDLEINWKASIKGSAIGMFDKPALLGSLAVEDESLYATFGNSQVVALNLKDGQQKWSSRLLSVARSKAVIFKDHIYIQTVDNKLVALEKHTGKVAWIHYGVDKEGEILHANYPLVINDIVFVNYTSGDVVALKPESGEEIWQKKFDNNIASRNATSDLTNSNPQIFFDQNTNAIVATSSRGNLIAFDASTGEQKYNKSLAISKSIWNCGTHIYFVSGDAHLNAASKADGSIAWRLDLSKFSREPKARIYWTAPIMVRSNILTISSEGTALLIDPADGSVIKEQEVPSNITAQPVVVDASIYLLSNDGSLYIYRE